MRHLWTFAFLVFFAVPALAQDEDCPASGDSLSAQKYRMSRGMEDCLRSGVDAEKVKAEQGELSSQIQFGLDSYTGGCGISQDYAEAYFWLSLILKNEKTPRNGKINYAFWRDDAAKHLTSDQIAAIDKRLAEWKPPRDEH